MRKIGVLAAVVGTLMMGTCGTGRDGRLELYLSDLPVGAEKVNVSLSAISALKSGGGQVSIAEEAHTYDLLELQNLETLIADAVMAPATYSQINFTVESGTIIISGVTYNLQVTNTQVTVPVSFVVASGKTALVVLDFNADASITETGPGAYSLAPVVQVKRVTF